MSEMKSAGQVLKEAENQQIARQLPPVMQMIGKFKKAIELSLPRHVNPERMMRVIHAAMTRTPDLLKCEPITVVNSLLHLSQLGLEPRANEAYLIPFNNRFKDSNGRWASRLECVPMIDYRGKVKLARQSGEVTDIVADVVRSRDKFRYEMTDEGVIFEHKPLKFRETQTGLIEVPLQERGPVVAAYAMAFLKENAKPHIAVMTMSEILEIREKSRAKDSGPWEMKDHRPVSENDFNEQCKKTLVHRLCKMIPQSVEMGTAQDLEDRVDVGLDLDDLVSMETKDYLGDAGTQSAADAVAERRIAEEQRNNPQHTNGGRENAPASAQRPAQTDRPDGDVREHSGEAPSPSPARAPEERKSPRDLRIDSINAYRKRVGDTEYFSVIGAAGAENSEMAADLSDGQYSAVLREFEAVLREPASNDARVTAETATPPQASEPAPRRGRLKF